MPFRFHDAVSKKKSFVSGFAALLLVFALILSLAGCGEQQTDPEVIAYKWDTMELISAENTKEALSYFGFSEAELAFADLDAFGLVKSVEFTKTGSFRFFYDKTATKTAFEDYIEALVDKLFENRESLAELFGEELSAKRTLVSFETAYAAQYDFKSFGEYVEYVTNELLVSYDLDNSLIEEGTFNLSADKIELKADKSTESEFVAYTLSGDELTIIYSDAKEVYKKA